MELFLIIFVFSILILLLVYAVHLFFMNKKLAAQKDELRKLSIDLKSQVVKKDSQSKESSIALKIVSDNTFDAIVILNNLGRISFWNKAAEIMFGYSAERVMDCDFIETIIPSDKVVEFNKEYDLHSKKELNTRTQLYHITAVRQDGTTFPAELKIADVRHEDTWNTIGIIRNITDSITLEKEMIMSEHRLKLALYGADENLWEWNVKTNELYISPSAQAMLGHDKKEIYTEYEQWLNTVHPEDRNTVAYELKKHLDGKIKMVRVEYRVKTAYGNWNWIFTRGQIIEFDDSNEPSRFFGVNTDINEQKQYELDLESIQEKVTTLKTHTKDVTKK